MASLGNSKIVPVRRGRGLTSVLERNFFGKFLVSLSRAHQGQSHDTGFRWRKWPERKFYYIEVQWMEAIENDVKYLKWKLLYPTLSFLPSQALTTNNLPPAPIYPNLPRSNLTCPKVIYSVITWLTNTGGSRVVVSVSRLLSSGALDDSVASLVDCVSSVTCSTVVVSVERLRWCFKRRRLRFPRTNVDARKRTPELARNQNKINASSALQVHDTSVRFLWGVYQEKGFRDFAIGKCNHWRTGR